MLRYYIRRNCIIKAHTKNRIWLTKRGNIVFREREEDTAVKNTMIC
jgi:hypothetical protein